MVWVGLCEEEKVCVLCTQETESLLSQLSRVSGRWALRLKQEGVTHTLASVLGRKAHTVGVDGSDFSLCYSECMRCMVRLWLGSGD